MGRLFSIQRVIAVLSMTARRRLEDFNVAELGKLLCIWILLRVGVIHAVNLGGFDDNVGVDLGCPQCCRGISGKEWIAGAGAENDNTPFFKVPDGAPADIGSATARISMADMTRVKTPMRSSESMSTMEFMTVPSIPM